MNNINFTSTYRIPITQAGVNPAKKDKLRELVEPYPNKLVSKNNSGTVRVSIPDKEDEKFTRQLKSIGYKVFQIFEGENIRRGKLDDYIKEKLALGEYQQTGKPKKRLSTFAKQKRHAKIAEKERAEEARIIAEAIEEIKKAKQEGRKVNYPEFDPYDTNFDFDEFEIK